MDSWYVLQEIWNLKTTFWKCRRDILLQHLEMLSFLWSKSNIQILIKAKTIIIHWMYFIIEHLSLESRNSRKKNDNVGGTLLWIHPGRNGPDCIGVYSILFCHQMSVGFSQLTRLSTWRILLLVRNSYSFILCTKPCSHLKHFTLNLTYLLTTYFGSVFISVVLYFQIIVWFLFPTYFLTLFILLTA